MKFIVDENAGKLVKILRLMGYDAVMFRSRDDSQLVSIVLAEDRVILTRDRHQKRKTAQGRIRESFTIDTPYLPSGCKTMRTACRHIKALRYARKA